MVCCYCLVDPRLGQNLQNQFCLNFDKTFIQGHNTEYFYYSRCSQKFILNNFKINYCFGQKSQLFHVL